MQRDNVIRNIKLAFMLLVVTGVLQVGASASDDRSPSLITKTMPKCEIPDNLVTLFGSNFDPGGIVVTIGGETAPILSSSPTNIDVLIPSTVSLGRTLIEAINPDGEVGAADFIVKGQEICGNNFDDDCDGDIDETNGCTSTTISIESGSNSITILQGESVNLVSVISLVNDSNDMVTVFNQETIDPDDGGVTVTSDFPPGGFTSSTTNSFVVNQSFQGVIPGNYQFTNLASIGSSGISAESIIQIVVLPPSGNPQILPLGSDPDTVEIGLQKEVTFTVAAANFSTPPDSVLLRSFDDETNPVISELFDNGTDGDLSAGDGVYSSTVGVLASQEGSLDYIASAIFPGVPDQVFSEVFSLQTTSCPVGLQPVDQATLVSDAQFTDPFVCDQVLVNLDNTDELTCAAIQAIANQVDGSVIGTALGLGLVQIQISNENCASSTVLNAVNTLGTVNNVAGASPNFVGTTTTVVTPNDPMYGTQTGPQQIRADEAWVLERGAPTIAVVDTGVNDAHEDLAGKVINGHDFISGDNDPDDEGDHGTHVAGIAAAATNNSKGIAGVAWNSKILAIRGIGGAYSAMAQAIKQAADKGAKIINISGGGPSDVQSVEDAVTYAVGKGSLVISTPANLSQVSAGDNYYPGAYSNALCVGAVDGNDGRSSGSNFAGYVDIAAPGDNILSLLSSGGYGNKSGVSMAAPHVAGVAAQIWSRYPGWSAAQVRERIEKTSLPLDPALNIGVGRVDAFEAVFNGSFEDDTRGWTISGTASAIENLGPITNQDRKKMAFASSGPDASEVETSIVQSFTVQPDVTSITLKFSYNFVTEEYPEFVGTQFNDNMRIILMGPGGSETQLAYEDVNTSSFSMVSGIDFPGGDSTVGQTGWKTVNMNVPITPGNSGTFSIVVRDEGDGIYDSNVLIDHIRFD